MKKIPKITEIISNPNQAFKNDELKRLLNQNPHKDWILKNKYANDSLYLPIDKIEYMLDVIFQEWKLEVLSTTIIFNAVSVNVRLHYKNPVTTEWMYHDGVGAKELQTIKDSGTLKPDFSNVNKSAVEMALPIAKTNALKDAADHLGKLFGRDLNRKHAIDYNSSYAKPTIDQTQAIAERNSLIEFIGKATDQEGLDILEIEIDKSDEELVLIFESKTKEIIQKQLKDQENGNVKR